MAQGYLRSMGMGEWTPKASAPDSAKGKQATVTLSPAKQVEPGIATTHKSRNNNNIIDDDQDFDFWSCDIRSVYPNPCGFSVKLYALDSFNAW